MVFGRTLVEYRWMSGMGSSSYLNRLLSFFKLWFLISTEVQYLMGNEIIKTAWY